MDSVSLLTVWAVFKPLVRMVRDGEVKRAVVSTHLDMLLLLHCTYDWLSTVRFQLSPDDNNN